MQSYQSRLDSFSTSVRVKNPSLTTSSSVKWPHPSSFTATPHTLAEAGFYFNPSWDDRDNVTCFICGKELSDWSQADDPFDIHWSKCRASCVWAVVRCGLREDVDQHGRHLSFHLLPLDRNLIRNLDMYLGIRRVCPLARRWRRPVWGLSRQTGGGHMTRSRITVPTQRRCVERYLIDIRVLIRDGTRWPRQASYIRL
jgi:hypothetical protein